MKTSFTGPIIALVLLVITLGGYGALRTMVAEKSVAVSRLNLDVVAKTNEAAHLEAVKEQLAALADVQQRVQAYFVPDAAVVSFINELQARGKALGADVEINSVAAVPAPKGGRPTLKVSLSIAGPFDAVVRTLGSVEYAPYVLTTTSFSLTADTEKKVWVATLNLVAISTKNAPTTGLSASTTATTTVEVASTTATTTKKKP